MCNKLTVANFCSNKESQMKVTLYLQSPRELRYLILYGRRREITQYTKLMILKRRIQM